MLDQNTNNQKRGGYIALVSSIIVVLLILATAAIVSNTGFFGLIDSENIARKNLSRTVALGCLDHALLYLADGDYEGSETVVFGDYSCTVGSITINGDETKIEASSAVRNSHTSLELVVDTFSLEKISLKEIE